MKTVGLFNLLKIKPKTFMKNIFPVVVYYSWTVIKLGNVMFYKLNKSQYN